MVSSFCVRSARARSIRKIPGLPVDDMSNFGADRGTSGFCEQWNNLNKLKSSACGNKLTSWCQIGRTMEKSYRRSKASDFNSISSAVLATAPEKATAGSYACRWRWPRCSAIGLAQCSIGDHHAQTTSRSSYERAVHVSL